MASSLRSLHESHHARFGGAPGPDSEADSEAGSVVEPVAGHQAGDERPLDFGDVDGERKAATEGVALFDRSAWEVLMVRGPEAEVFLNGLTTNQVVGLAPGVLSPGLICTTKGKILYAVDVVATRPDQFLLICEPGEGSAVAKHLEAYHIREDVEIGRVPLTCLDLLGPEADQALVAMGHPASEAIGSFGEAPVIACHHPMGALPRRVVLLPEPVAAAWAEALLAASPGAKLMGQTAHEAARIAAREPRAGVDYGTDHLPAEGALYDRLSFTKGCYVGQEVHARLHYRGHVNRKLMALEIPAAASEGTRVGDLLYAEGAEVGHLTGLVLPVAGASGEPALGIAMVRHKQAADRTALSLGPDGAATVTLWPMATDLGAEKA